MRDHTHLPNPRAGRRGAPTPSSAGAGRDRVRERRDDRPMASPAADFPGTGENATTRPEGEGEQRTSPEFDRILALTPRKLSEGSPVEAASFARDTIRRDLASLQGGADFARYWLLVAVYKVVGIVRQLRSDPARSKAVGKAIGIGRGRKPYLAVFHGLSPLTAPKGSPQRKSDLDRYSDYNCALTAAREQGLSPRQLLARLVDDGGIEGLLEQHRDRLKEGEEAGEGGSSEGLPRERRSQRRRKEREEQAALAAAAERIGAANGGGVAAVARIDGETSADAAAGEASPVTDQPGRRYPVRAVKRPTDSGPPCRRRSS